MPEMQKSVLEHPAPKVEEIADCSARVKDEVSTESPSSISTAVSDKKSVLEIFERYLENGTWARMGFEKSGESFSVWATNENEEPELNA